MSIFKCEKCGKLSARSGIAKTHKCQDANRFAKLAMKRKRKAETVKRFVENSVME